MTLLCTDCQQHDIYLTQFRAMFVQNCRIDNLHVLRVPERASRPSRNAEHGADLYYSVRCAQCNTEVGVYDSNEVYHFCHVLPSGG